MKNNFLYIYLLITFILLSSSCKKNHIFKEKIEFANIHVNKQIYPSAFKHNPCAHIIIDFTYPKRVVDYKNLRILQNLFIKKMFGKSFNYLTPKKAVQKYTIQYLQKCKTTFDKIKNISSDEYYIHIKNKIIYQGNHLLSFTVTTTTYEGGAHQSKSLYAYVFDLSKNKLINENQFLDILSYSKNISTVLIDKLIKKNKCIKKIDLETQGYTTSSIIPNNNFTVDEKGITYYFNEYEIGSYFLGLTQILISYPEIKMYILKNSPLSPLVKNELGK